MFENDTTRCTCSEPERWAPTPVEHYEVSTHGRVRSLPRWVPNSRGGERHIPGGILAYGGTRYRHVQLGKGVTGRVHVLVALAFAGPRPAGNVARHYDDLPHHCCSGNILWGTHSDNAADRIRNRRERLASVA
jgi:hypothetical protein